MLAEGIDSDRAVGEERMARPGDPDVALVEPAQRMQTGRGVDR